MSNPYNVHGINPVARAAAHNAHSTATHSFHKTMAHSMQAHKRAIATHKRMTASGIAAHNRAARRMRNAPRIENKLATLKSALRKATSKRLVFSRLEDSGRGVAIFIESNWKSQDGIPRLVLGCNTLMPGSDSPVVAFLLTDEGVEGVDFRSEAIEHAASRGRLFVFPATVRFAGGEAYSVRPALSTLDDSGAPGIWSYATVGFHQGRLFAVGPGRIGSFVDQAGENLVTFRPLTWSDKANEWVWVGRSEVTQGGRLRFKIADPLARPRAGVSIDLPRSGQEGNVSAVKCSLRDDRGDPLGVVRIARSRTYGVREVGGRLQFFAAPNLQHPNEGPLFAHSASRGSDGQPVFIVPFRKDGEDLDLELPANHREADGSRWFVARANATDPTTRRPMALVPLSQA